MQKNLMITGWIAVTEIILLELAKGGLGGADAYKIVQRNAKKVCESLQEGQAVVNERGESLYLQYLLDDSELVELLSKGGDSGETIIRECFDYSYYTKNVDSIFKRVFGE